MTTFTKVPQAIEDLLENRHVYDLQKGLPQDLRCPRRELRHGRGHGA